MYSIRLRPALAFALVALVALSPAGAARAEEANLSDDERRSAVEALTASHRAFEELVAEVDPSDWARKPAPEKWSIGEVAEHILLSEKMILGVIGEALAGEPNPDWRTDTAGKMERIEQFMPDRSTKAQAPEYLQPTGELSREDCLSDLAAWRARTLEFVKKTQRPIKSYTVPHPSEYFGDLNIYQWLHFMAAHHVRHNAQIEEVENWIERDKAGVLRSSTNGFAIRHEAVLEASPGDIYHALTTGVSTWWDPDHTYSGDSANLSLDARPQGCFCESLPNGGGVRHLTVVYADPGRLLRLTGGLGPLQGEGVAGSLSWTMEEAQGGTRLVFTYNVAGTVDGGLDAWAGVVGRMWKTNFQRLIEHAGGE